MPTWRLIFLGLSLSLAGQSTRLVAEEELYSITPRKMAEAESEPADNPSSLKMFTGLENTLAELIAFYPKGKIAFIGRDMEAGYLAAMTLFADHPEIQRRFVLVNVSRGSMGTPLMKPYLAQFDITDEALSGEPLIVVDSCCDGTVASAVRRSFADPKKVLGHYIYAANGNATSSRVYFDAFHEEEARWMLDKPFEVTFAKDYFEALPKYTHKANALKETAEGIQPVSERYDANLPGVDPVVLKRKKEDGAMKLYGNVKHHFAQDAVKGRVTRLAELMRTVLEATDVYSDRDVLRTALALGELRDRGITKYVRDVKEASGKGNIPLTGLDAARFFQVFPAELRRSARDEAILRPSSEFISDAQRKDPLQKGKLLEIILARVDGYLADLQGESAALTEGDVKVLQGLVALKNAAVGAKLEALKTGPFERRYPGLIARLLSGDGKLDACAMMSGNRPDPKRSSP